jgi:protein-export membrane protein SecD
MWKKIILVLFVLVLSGGVAMFVFKSEPGLNKNFDTAGSFLKNHPFRLGLDLSGGSHLVYEADTSLVPAGQVGDSMNSLRDVIERRINIFGVSEPVVQVQHSGLVSGSKEQLIVDLPGVTDLNKAKDMIGKTPLLEFKTEAPLGTPQKATVDENGQVVLDIGSQFVSTELTGRYLKKATLEFDPNTREPVVKLQFDDIGTKLFADMTKNNIGKTVAIFLDGSPISTPVVREEIPNGEAVISGRFNPAEAKQLVGRLSSGALPVPIKLLSTQTVGASLGDSATSAGVKSGVIGFLFIALFLLIWYRLPGLVAVLSLGIFTTIVLALFKLIPVTLTTAGIAGFIISMGIAVDANVLIFERIKEELRAGRNIGDAVSAGFSRAWSSIRDSNLSTIITAIILFWFGTALIKGFALTLGLGVLVSIFTAISVSKVFLSLLSFLPENKFTRFLFSSGVSSGRVK